MLTQIRRGCIESLSSGWSAGFYDLQSCLGHFLLSPIDFCLCHSPFYFAFFKSPRRLLLYTVFCWYHGGWCSKTLLHWQSYGVLSASICLANFHYWCAINKLFEFCSKKIITVYWWFGWLIFLNLGRSLRPFMCHAKLLFSILYGISSLVEIVTRTLSD